MAAAALVLVLALGIAVYLLFFTGGVSKEEFVQQADDICEEALDKAAGIAVPTDTDLESSGRLFAEVRPILETQIRQIRALEPPEEDADVLQDWLGTQSELVDVFGTAAEAASSGNQEGFDEAFAEANAIQGRSSSLAEEYGFEVCGVSTPS